MKQIPRIIAIKINILEDKLKIHSRQFVRKRITSILKINAETKNES